MADFLPPIVGYVRMDVAQAIAGLEAVKVASAASTSASSASMKRWNKDTSEATSSVVGGLAVVGIGLAVAAAASITMAGDFESATNRLVTSAGEQRANIDKVRTGLLDMAGQVGSSAMDLTAAYYQASSAGFTFAHGGLDVVRAAAEGAKTEGADLKVVTDAVTSAMIDYHQPASAAAQVTTTLVAAVSQGKTTFQELTGSLHSVLPVASAAHISLADITAAVASMTVHGMSAQQATENLAHTIGHLQTLTAPQAKELAALGIATRGLSLDLGPKGLTGTIQEISNAIQSRMGPDGQVVLNLQQALAKLPPEVQKLGAAAAAGTISMGDYAKATKGLSVEAAGQAAGFATLLKSTHGIGQDQKSGATIMQTYASALKAATGDSTTLNTALMLTGENAAYTSAAVKAVAGATTEAGNHVAGWSSIQATFNQKLSEARAGLEAAAISMGTRLLPMATQALGVLAAHIPDIVAVANRMVDVAVAVGSVVAKLGPFLPLIATAVGLFIAWRTAMTIGMALEGVVVAVEAFSAGLAVLSGTEGLAAAAQWALNIAMDANPIGLVILAIAALIGVGILIVTHWSQIVAFLGGVWNAAWTRAVALFGVVRTAVTGFVSEVVSAIGGFFSRVGTMVSAGWTEFARHPLYWIGYLLIFIPMKLGELIVQFVSWVGLMSAHATAWALSMVVKAAEMGTNFQLAVGRELLALPGQVWGWLSNVIPRVVAWITDMEDRAGKAGIQFGVALGNELEKLPGQVWDIGVSIAKGLIGGLVSFIPNAIKAAGDFIAGMIGGANAAAGNPHSPAPATIPLGIALAQGIGEGVRLGSAGAQGAMAGLVGGMTGGGPPGSVGAVGTGAGPAGLSTLSMEDTNELLAHLYRLLDERLPRAPGATFSRAAYGS